MKFITIIIFCFILLCGCKHSDDVKQKQNNNNQNSQQEIPPNDKSEPAQTVSVQQIISQAQKGKALNIPFFAHQHTISDVKKGWGEPNSTDLAGSGYYATYTMKHAAFGYTKEGLIFDVRSYDPSIQNFTLAQIKQVMGEPTTSTVNNQDNIYMYKLNSQYQLKWVIPKSTGKVDHISVVSPNDISTHIEESYILSIKGTSQNLSVSAWENMVKWRKDILFFPKNYPNDVFVNGPNKKMVALSFDDGPDLINTPKIIAALKAQNVKGTFFFIGEKVQKYPEIVKSAYDNGNVIGSHSFYHHELPKETEVEIEQDLAKTSVAIHNIIGRSPALLRPPYGETDVNLVKIAKRDNDKIILWSIDTLDWSQREQAHIEKNVFDNIRNGDIILMHSDEDKTETAKAVPQIINELKRRGFQIVDIATLLNTDAYK